MNPIKYFKNAPKQEKAFIIFTIAVGFAVGFAVAKLVHIILQF